MATINSINLESNPLASTAITIDPGASGDSYVQFNINTTGEFRIGVDDTNNDSFIFSQGSALGTNNFFSMNSDGIRTMPSQVAFLAYNSATDSNVTGDGTVYTLEFDAEVFDQSGDYNNSTDTFTAPITGRYHLQFGAQVRDIQTTTPNNCNYTIVTSNRSYQSMVFDPSVFERGTGPANENFSMFFSVLADMDTSDTCTCTITISGGTKTIDILGTTTIITHFAGNLIC